MCVQRGVQKKHVWPTSRSWHDGFAEFDPNFQRVKKTTKRAWRFRPSLPTMTGHSPAWWFRWSSMLSTQGQCAERWLIEWQSIPKNKKRKLLQHESKFHYFVTETPGVFLRKSWRAHSVHSGSWGMVSPGISLPCAACSAWRHIDLWEKGWVGWEGIGFQHGWFHPLVEDANPNTHLQLELSQVYWSLLVVKLFCNQREWAPKNST